MKEKNIKNSTEFSKYDELFQVDNTYNVTTLTSSIRKHNKNSTHLGLDNSFGF